MEISESKMIKSLIKVLGESQYSFAKKIGVPQSRISMMINRNSVLSSDFIRNIIKAYPQVNIEWLITGKGEMIKADKPQSNNYSDMSETLKERTTAITIPLLPISAQGGSFNEFVATIRENECERVISPIANADWCITVSGDSMYPEYPSGSKVLIRRINEKAFIDWGRTFVLDTCNGTVIKKLFPSDNDPSKLKCVSVNPSYPPFDVSFEDIFGIYRVLICMSER